MRLVYEFSMLFVVSKTNYAYLAQIEAETLSQDTRCSYYAATVILAATAIE